MTDRDLRTELAMFFGDPSKRDLRSHTPPATPPQVDDVMARAVKELGVPLAQEYVCLVSFVNGSGYTTCFYATHNRVLMNVFKQREEIALGIIEENHLLRKREVIDAGELAYATGDCVFLQDPVTGQWIGRDRTTREVLLKFPTFLDLVHEAYG